uniref:Uncharacterized protein n=1 Tax=Nelumbo nucifera TaxID=4432 RepID=A0A822YAA1_NELNU|nr:TPA_asm: hypothetical protein HUJ06_009865 [Nelumbo nucifera]
MEFYGDNQWRDGHSPRIKWSKRYLRSSGSNTSAVHSSLTTDLTYLEDPLPASGASPSTPPAAKPQNCTRLPSKTASSSPPAPARYTLSQSRHGVNWAQKKSQPEIRDESYAVLVEEDAMCVGLRAELKERVRVIGEQSSSGSRQQV